MPIDTLAFLQFSLDGIEIVKKSDVLKRETNYFVAIDSLNPDIKDLFTQDDSTKVCDVLGSSCIQFDDFIRKFIRFPDKNLLSSLNFKEMKYTKLDIPPKDKNLQEIICYDSDKDVFLQVTNNGLYTPIKREYAAQCLWLGVDYNKGMEVAKSFGLNISESEKDYYQPSLVTLYDMKRKLKFEMLHLHGWYKMPNAPCFYTFIEDKKPNKIIIKKIKDICYRLLSFSESESTFKIKDLPHPKQMLVEKSEKGEPLAFYNFFPIKAKDV